MKETILRNSETLSSVKSFPFVFEEGIFKCSAHNSKSLIAMLSHKNKVHIVTTKGIFGKKM